MMFGTNLKITDKPYHEKQKMTKSQNLCVCTVMLRYIAVSSRDRQVKWFPRRGKVRYPS